MPCNVQSQRRSPVNIFMSLKGHETRANQRVCVGQHTRLANPMTVTVPLGYLSSQQSHQSLPWARKAQEPMYAGTGETTEPFAHFTESFVRHKYSSTSSSGNTLPSQISVSDMQAIQVCIWATISFFSFSDVWCVPCLPLSTSNSQHDNN